MKLYPPLEEFIEKLDYSGIPQERRQELQKLSSLLHQKSAEGKRVNLNFICTHNSRRSQLCQVWATAAIAYFELEAYRAFSGGTAVTAFHPNAVKALEDSGFRITGKADSENPRYSIRYSDEGPALQAFSKLYDEAVPGSEAFIAILTCADAEANCPFIPEAEARISLRYEDPRTADGGPREDEVYMARNRQIATELFYLFSKLNLHGISKKTQLS